MKAYFSLLLYNSIPPQMNTPQHTQIFQDYNAAAQQFIPRPTGQVDLDQKIYNHFFTLAHFLHDKFEVLIKEVNELKTEVTLLKNAHEKMNNAGNLYSKLDSHFTSFVERFATFANLLEAKPLVTLPVVERECEASHTRCTEEKKKKKSPISIIHCNIGSEPTEQFVAHLREEIIRKKKGQAVLQLAEVSKKPSLVDDHTCLFIFRRTSNRFVESLTAKPSADSVSPLEVIQRIKSTARKVILIGLHERYKGESSVFNPSYNQMETDKERDLLAQVEDLPKYDIAYYNRNFYLKNVLEHLQNQFM